MVHFGWWIKVCMQGQWRARSTRIREDVVMMVLCLGRCRVHWTKSDLGCPSPPTIMINSKLISELRLQSIKSILSVM